MTKPIRICFISPKAYPLFKPSVKKLFGGAELDLYLLATELAKDNNFAVSFITADYGQPNEEKIQNVRVLKSLDFNKNSLIGAIKIWQALKAAGANIYMLKTASLGAFLVAFFCKLKKRIFIYRTANKGECFGDYIREHFFCGRAFKWTLKNAKIVFVQNEDDKNGIKRTIGIESIALPNGHRIEPPQKKNRNTILWVGRSARIKHAEKFLELAKAFPYEHFTIICQKATGDSTYSDLVAQANFMDNLDFIESVPFHEIQSYFQRAKLFVNTSNAEGFPNTFIQACIAATPISSLNVNPDNFLDKYNCGICANGDWTKFLNALKILSDEKKAQEYGNNGLNYVKQNHDVEKIIEQYKKIFYD